MTDDIKQYIFNTYVLTQKRLTQQIEISEDLLTASIYEEWESEEALQSFRNDEFLQQFWELRDAYNESVGIVATALDIKQLD